MTPQAIKHYEQIQQQYLRELKGVALAIKAEIDTLQADLSNGYRTIPRHAIQDFGDFMTTLVARMNVCEQL